MTENQLRLLLSLEPDDLKWHESWCDDWEALYALNLIQFKSGSEIPTLTDHGRHTIVAAVAAATNFIKESDG